MVTLLGGDEPDNPGGVWSKWVEYCRSLKPILVGNAANRRREILGREAAGPERSGFEAT